MLVNMGMSVDHTGQDKLAADVDVFLRTFKVRADGRDFAVRDADIQNAVEPLGRVDDPAALENEIVFLPAGFLCGFLCGLLRGFSGGHLRDFL